MAQNKVTASKEATSKSAPVQATQLPYAIIQTGGKQYQAIEGKTLAIEKLNAEPGAMVEFKDVLLRKSATGAVQIGQPFLSGPVKASIIKHIKGPKVIIFKFKRRKKCRVKKGHRQPITVVRIEAA